MSGVKDRMETHRIGEIKIFPGASRVPQAFDAVVVVLFSSGRMVLVKNEERGWEFPGGHREGQETFRETAIREVREEACAEMCDLRFLGYYSTAVGHVTIIVCAEVLSFHESPGEERRSDVGLFERLPPRLSFGDGREQVFLQMAEENRKRDSSAFA
jgi:8-oxo-dGTP diphosphatase